MTSRATGPVLITGAFGQVGRRCTEILLDRGRTVVAMELRNDTTVATAEELATRGGTLIPAYVDLLDADAVAALVAEHQPVAIVHLAAIFAPSSYRNPRLARKVNVGGTENLLAAAAALSTPPLFLYASSAAVYGSRNPHRYPERITASTPVDPIDQYGEDKVLAEKAIAVSGLPHAVLRLAGIISPDGASNMNADYLLLMRATPGDNRMHTVDSRDVALAFANAVDRGDAIDGKTLLIAGDDSHVRTHRELEDEMMEAVGLGRLGNGASLPGDPDDDRGWSFTGWFDTSESQSLLNFQQHTWPQTKAWVADAMGARRLVIGLLGPVARPALRLVLQVQRHVEGRGRYADPWTLIERKYGSDVLTPTDY
ncbi:oxidoreductase [Mycolicibacterium madagascariense]|uniref:Oxidoreductase n=1 Tax=Mycolicibacterium madagascariense TaxID=212765 RepID=A0A7I7XFF8_9MYCO|nr:NAD(P)-dependent oxidoreductase [Mycolicibacterium madagascariense]MCV7013667.1 NAD(P)-dependent oxidoreductase [Mycolicibacterium madagascariense]BBZ27919.1 oxidoreductase [Mycolicibacterium madagascariense]